MLALLASALAAPPYADLAELAWRQDRVGRAAADIDVRTDVLGWPAGARVRVTPVVDGLVVDGADDVVALDPEGRVRRIVGPRVALHAPARGTLGADDAIAALAPIAASRGQLWPPRAEPRLLAIDGALRHVWRVDHATSDPPTTWVSWVDATTGVVLRTDQTSAATEGWVYGVSPPFGPPEPLDLAYLTSDATLTGIYSDAYSCTDWTLSEALFAVNTCDAVTRYAWPVDGGYPYAPHPGTSRDPFAEVNLYHHVSEVASFFDERYGLRPPAPIRTIANFPMANAFYGDFDGDGVGDLSFGFTDDVQFAYDADVVYHEFGHWVVGRIANIPSLGADELGLQWAGGSLNEGAADVFSMLLTGDPDVGEYTGSAFRDGPIRALEADRTCPQGLAGEVHRDGEMLGALGWNLIEAVGWEVTSDLFFGAVSMWGPDVSWKKAGESLLDSASDLEDAGVVDAATASRIREIVDASGLPDCSRIIPLVPDEPVEAFVLSAGLEGDLFRIPGGAQMSIEVPQGADRLTIDVSGFTGVDDGLAWSLYVRKGEPVRMAPTELAAFGLGFAVAQEWDWLVDGEGAAAHIAFDATSDPPLEPGATYYIAVAGRDAGPIELFDFTLGRLYVDAAPFTFEAQPRGCSAVGAPSAVLGLLPVAGLAMRRRSRPQRASVAVE